MKTRQPLAVALRLAFGAFAFAGLIGAAGAADESPPPVSEGPGFSEQGGALLYRGICQACHMPHGEGASGAGMYPALRGNPRLASATYPVYTVLQGRNGMPAFRGLLTDEQVAEVVNFVRTNLDNHYTDAVTASDVGKLR